MHKQTRHIHAAVKTTSQTLSFYNKWYRKPKVSGMDKHAETNYG